MPWGGLEWVTKYRPCSDPISPQDGTFSMIRKVVHKLYSSCLLHLFLNVPCKRCPVGVPWWSSGYRTRCSRCHGPGSIPGWGPVIPQALQHPSQQQTFPCLTGHSCVTCSHMSQSLARIRVHGTLSPVMTPTSWNSLSWKSEDSWMEQVFVKEAGGTQGVCHRYVMNVLSP